MNSAPADPILVIAGPTAAGKSALALKLADEFAGTLINADSMQVYRELRVLTARPSPADEARQPHRIYGTSPAAESCSAGIWCRMAGAAAAEAREAGRLPILVGGTGLYLKAFMEGLDGIPDIDPGLRQQVRDLYQREGAEHLYAELQSRDPVMAARLSSRDPQRLIRAFEVLEGTGRSLTEWQSGGNRAPAVAAKFTIILIAPPRDELYAACDARVLRMIDEGALDEVSRLTGMGLDSALPAMKALGVQPLARHLASKITLDVAVQLTQKATRNFAKRQNTWFNHQISSDQIIGSIFEDTQLSKSFLEDIFSFIRKKVLTAQ